jgi:LuxR family maltose regulon positive regulatory protein
MTNGQILLDRPRLDRLFEKTMAYPVVLVRAGPGYGKTQAVSSFLSRYDAKTVWVQLAPEDNLSWHFWEHYAGAVARTCKDSGDQIAELGFPETIRQFDRYVSLLYEESGPRKKIVTVFDDFHLIRDPAMLDFFRRALNFPLSNSAIILIARSEPELNLVPLLARGSLAEITGEELRFSAEETARLFQIRNIPLGEAGLARISRDTEGWALAVDMVARDLGNGGNGGNGEKNGGPFLSESFRKIGEELFAALETERQNFLIKLSLIDYWPLELLELFPAEQSGPEAMDDLSAFVRRDDYIPGFRVSRLFVDFLREKQGRLPPAELREVYRRAAEWGQKNQLRLDAAAWYERAGDYRGLLGVISSLPRIPPLRVAAFLLDIIDRAAYAPASTEASAFSEAAASEKAVDDGGDLLFLRYIVRANLLMCLGRFDESTALCREAISRFEPQAPGTLRSRILLGAYNNLGTLTLLTCRFTRDYNCRRWFEQACQYHSELSGGPREPVRQSNIGSYVIQVGSPVVPGEIERALEEMDEGISWGIISQNGGLAGTVSLARAELAYYQDDLAGVEQFARQAAYQGRENKQYEVENRALFYLLRLNIHGGSAGKMRELRRRLEAQLEIPGYLNRYTIYDIGMGRFYAQVGLTGKIAPWIRDEYEEGELNARFHNFNVLVKAWCLFAEKDYAAAAAALKPGENRRNLESFLLGKLDITVLEAAIRFHLGEPDRALELLEAAWNMAAPNSLDMPFVELGEDMRLLAGAALDRLSRDRARPGGIPKSWLERIRNRASAYSKKLGPLAERILRAERQDQNPAVYLTYRERKVLAGLARGLGREEIAGEAGLSLNTVKGVIRVIYGKLGAINRADAIRIALDRGILGPPL